jgi:hypothetical protein
LQSSFWKFAHYFIHSLWYDSIVVLHYYSTLVMGQIVYFKFCILQIFEFLVFTHKLLQWFYILSCHLNIFYK